MLGEVDMAKRPKPVHQMTTSEFEARFYSEEACRTYLIARRWPNGVHCPRCGNAGVTALDSGFHWQCYACAPDTSYRFSGIAGTIFENTNKPLYDWFKVTHLMLTSKKGMSALQIMRFMGFGSYKTAWGMCHKIRAALIEPEKKLGGIVEVDETWVGGKGKNKHNSERGDRHHHPSKLANKTPIIGAVQRKGNIITRVLQSVSKDDAQAFVREVVSNKVSLLASDESRVYNGLDEYNHKRSWYAAHRYVIGAIHTNTIEGFWSIFKRSIVGSYHKVSRKYLPLYIAECQFKYNNRFNDDIFGVAIGGC
jgi:ISXO2-like transposase domain/Transposase zinc-ribbon domain